ncbi:MAG: hypothetical protein [Bacteriophage sp.]|jgi:hypothetical protein|nr:MAG: hypothetical protein [Bacteriophage sp.]UWF82421.1 MAG: hypothetical protein [Bacteriophage sp.]
MIDWLKKYILTLDKKCEITNSNTTDSVYYTFGTFKIRVSNHLPSNFNSCDISIVRSLNTKFYIVTVKHGSSALVLTYKELKTFLCSTYWQYKLNTVNAEMRKKAKEIYKEYVNSDDWEIFVTCTDITSSKYKTLSKHQKGILKKQFINNQIRGEKFIEGLKKINSTMSDEEIEDTFNTL